MLKLSVIFLLLCFFIFLILFGYTWFRLRWYVDMHSTSGKVNLPVDLSPHTEYVMSSDGLKIAYWYFPVKNAKAVIILVHGYSNPGGKSLATSHVSYLRDAGYSTVLIDLRAHGESDGHQITLGMTEWKDVSAMTEKMRSLPENQSLKIGLYGVSMGAATSIVTAGTTHQADFVIASVPYKSINSLFEYQIQQQGYPSAIFLPLMKLAAKLEFPANYLNYTPEKNIKNIHVPILILAAAHDKEVKPQDAKDLFNSANQPKEFYEIDSPHDIFWYQPDEFKKRVLDFLKKYANQEL